MKLDAIMRRFPPTVESTDTLIHARDFMVWGDFQHLPVIDRLSGRLVGILTNSDIARHQSTTGQSIWSDSTTRVDTAMSHDVYTAGPDDSLAEAARQMSSRRIGCLPITEHEMLIGLVTIRDVLKAGARGPEEPEQVSEPLVEDVMTWNPPCVHPDDHLVDAGARMLQYEVRHLPVVDGDGHVIGMLFEREVRACVGELSRAFTDEESLPASLLRVSSAMKPPVLVMHHQSCVTAARALADACASAVPVVDDDNLLVGVVSYVELLRAFTQ